MTLPLALKRALAIVSCQRVAYLQAGGSRYRLIPSEGHSRGYAICLSVRYNDEWQPWGDVTGFGVDDVLCDKWAVV